MDEADFAQIVEEREREAGVSRVVDRQHDRPMVIEGVRVCRCCNTTIPVARIEAAPYAVRCTYCQSLFERYNNKG